MTDGVAAGEPEVEIFADGACSGNPGPGGWGALLRHLPSAAERRLSGAEAMTTNNRMELLAVIQALASLSRPCRVRVVTDSAYVVNAFAKGWLAGWERNQWRTSGKTPVKNVDLWLRLRELSSRHRVEWRWIRGHGGHRENEEADRLAVAARKRLRDRPADPEGGGGFSEGRKMDF
ncbi:MAG: ribonuclease HI [Planctomycetota bacterium]|jgi:ribonuclease HI|nr:ribonuclease HI [Planctomycetota bacterium]